MSNATKPKRGRPSKGISEEKLTLLLSRELLGLTRASADAEGVGLSEWWREAARRHLATSGHRTASRIPSKGDQEALAFLVQLHGRPADPGPAMLVFYGSRKAAIAEIRRLRDEGWLDREAADHLMLSANRAARFGHSSRKEKR